MPPDLHDPPVLPQRPRTPPPATPMAGRPGSERLRLPLPGLIPSHASPTPPTPPNGPALALQLYGRLLGARSAQEAAHRLVADLAQRCAATRVSVGLRQGGRTRLLAVSSLDEGPPQAEAPMRLVAALDEAIDQALPMIAPPPPGAPDAIRLAQHALLRGAGSSVLSLPGACTPPGPRSPGRADGAPASTDALDPVAGALCLEREAGPPFTVEDAARLAPLLTLALPLLALLARAEEAWPRRLARQLRGGLAALRQPRRRGLRAGLAAGGVLLLLAAAWPMPQAVSGRARVEGAVQRVLVAPADGFVGAVHARPGDRVLAGAPLVDLMAQDLELEQQRLASQLAQHESAYAAALAKADRAQAALAVARISEAQAQIGLLEGQLGRSRLTAPFDAVVIDGDFSRSVGAPVRQGEPLLTVATGDRFRVIVEVDETDVPAVQPGQAGQLKLSGGSLGAQTLQVERVAALARVVEGRNVFEVEARLSGAPAGAGASSQLRPGLLGQAEIVVGRRPPLLAWAERLAGRLRLAWWRW